VWTFCAITAIVGPPTYPAPIQQIFVIFFAFFSIFFVQRFIGSVFRCPISIPQLVFQVVFAQLSICLDEKSDTVCAFITTLLLLDQK
jgi:hypothetical protein